jgi:hypothetical protein
MNAEPPSNHAHLADAGSDSALARDAVSGLYRNALRRLEQGRGRAPTDLARALQADAARLAGAGELGNALDLLGRAERLLEAAGSPDVGLLAEVRSASAQLALLACDL